MDSYTINVNGSMMHYKDVGQGDPIIFLHGVPTSSFLWRNIIPYFVNHARCIAPDLIGMGQSAKPNIDYKFLDHVIYIENFIEKLQLNNITFVMHGLGSAIGFDYAKNHPNKIKALAFYEAHICPGSCVHNNSSLLVKQLTHNFAQNPQTLLDFVNNEDFSEKILNFMSLKKLSADELATYKQPFIKLKNRTPILQYMQEFIIGKDSATVVDKMDKYSKWLTTTNIPKLLCYSTPGFITEMSTVNWCKENLANLTIVDLEEGLHFAQEYNPKLFGQLLQDWYLNLFIKKSTQN